MFQPLFFLRYCGSLFVGHCRSDQLVEHYEEFASEMGWDSSYLLHLGMDGPNVNLKFQQDLKSHLKETQNKNFLDIDTCTLHKVHTSFKKGILQIPIDIDNFAVNLHGFFKLSSARREDYRDLEAVTDVTAHYVLRHSSVRWLTMKYVIVRIIEQWSNLQEYFLTFLPKQKEFKQSIKETKRYKQIVEVLKDELALPYLSFTSFLANQYEGYLLKFQSEEPLIHMLHSGMSNLLTGLMKCFVNKKTLFESNGVTLKPIDSLVYLNLNQNNNLKSRSLIEVGTHAKLLLQGITDDLEKSFRSACLKSYKEATIYLQQNLPFNNKVIEYSQYLHPEKRNHVSSKSAISNLALKLTDVFGNQSQSVFQTSGTSNEIVDLVRSQWSMYQIEDIQPSLYIVEESGESSKERKSNQNSYWKYALEYCGLYSGQERPRSKFIRVDCYWNNVGKITNEEGVLKYPQLFALAKAVLSLSHGNVVPERGFSINKYLLSVHGDSLKEETIVALRLIKDELCAVGGLSNFQVTKSLLKSVEASYRRYQDFLEAERTIKQNLEKLQREKEIHEQEKEEEGNKENMKIQMGKDIEYTKDEIKQLESTMEEANKTISTALREDVFCKKKVASASTLIDMAIERKQKLNETLKELVEKKQKLE